MTSNDTKMAVDRGSMALIGGVAGLAAWILVDVIPDVISNPHVLVVLSAAIAGYFVVLLAINGPVPLGKAALGAAVLAVPAALLLGWASLRFETSEGLFNTGFSLLAWCLILALGTPFLAVWSWDRHYWNSYLDLFDVSWSIVVRYAAAWLFVGVFWAALFLSDALLSLVSITIIDDLIDHEPVPQVLTGAVLGLALRVVYEMREYLSPYLLLRLLRLLLPVFLVVVVIFVLALPFSDPAKLFGNLSPAATLMSVALGGIGLISVALDKSDADATRAGWMQLVVKAMALLLPVLAALACYGVWLRVVQYGWTPDRLAAAVAAGIVSVYALLYFLAVLAGTDWMSRIRASNLWVAGIVLGLCVLWLSPILNPEAISARSQASRYLSGKTVADHVAAWELTHEWGKAGRSSVDQLNALPDADHAELQRILDLAEREDSRHAFEQRLSGGRDSKITQILNSLRVLPEETVLDPEALRRLPKYRLDEWHEACSASEIQKCILILADFNASPGQEGVLFLPEQNDTYEAIAVRLQDDILIAGKYLRDMRGGQNIKVSNANVQRLLDGDYRIAPSSRNSLWIGGLEIHPEN
ncbi:protein of unknown function [Shimia gijangensis]|uniref:DUF4153 domain-containing protein n=1 Tax=Shimia gijangensis TaxID=1470563 RepID=A0A1M6LJQ1_9RHOB|nr:DUF4153 domain-containing protein [Shimia gijangensis]SHJ71403.1 protein of unknown function [Shimia gijangensis]